MDSLWIPIQLQLEITNYSELQVEYNNVNVGYYSFLFVLVNKGNGQFFGLLYSPTKDISI